MRSENQRIADMLVYSRKARAIALQAGDTGFFASEHLLIAASYALLVVGEAASHVRPETRAEIDYLPLREVVGMRNALAHKYFLISAQVVYDTCVFDLPILNKALEEWLKAHGHTLPEEP